MTELEIRRPRSMLAVYDIPEIADRYDAQVQPLSVAPLVRALDAAPPGEAVLFALDTLGGQIDAVCALASAIADAKARGVRVVAWVPSVAGSGAAFLPLFVSAARSPSLQGEERAAD